MFNKIRSFIVRVRATIARAVAKTKSAALRTAVRLQTATAFTVYRLRTEQIGQASWVNELMILGIVVIIAVLVFAFWKAGGAAWVNSRLNDITQY